MSADDAIVASPPATTRAARYTRAPEYDRRAADGGDCDGNGWFDDTDGSVVILAVGYDPNHRIGAEPPADRLYGMGPGGNDVP
ncbi:MAG TPA: hypothetical protein VFQ88_14115 [Nevskiaceae bacterium]|nr:hypothetical protein [Nevskiaceae bacterium]